MQMSLLTKNKIGFTNGSIEEQDCSDSIYPYWRHCNTLILVWTVCSIDPVIVQSIQSIDNVRALWRELQEQYS